MCIPPPVDWEPETSAEAPAAPPREPPSEAQGDAGEGDGTVQQQQPAPSPQPAGPSPTRVHVAEVPPVSEVDARNALLSMVTEHCCWGKAAARNMAINKIASTSAFHVRPAAFVGGAFVAQLFERDASFLPCLFSLGQYEIQTFTEKRETAWAFMPHSGGEIDGPRCGPAPRPWDIPSEPAEMFKSEMKVLQVPHTASVKTCHRCRGAGSLLCQECHGKGWVSRAFFFTRFVFRQAFSRPV